MSRKLILILFIGIVTLGIIVYIAYLVLRFGDNRETSVPTSTESPIFLPSGEPINDTETNASQTPATPAGETQQPIPVTGSARLQKTTSFPITNYVPFFRTELVSLTQSAIDPKTGQESVLTRSVPTSVLYARYNKKDSGYLYEQKLSGENRGEKLIATTLIPNVEEALYTPTGESVVFRFFNENSNNIESFVGTVTTQAVTGTVCKESFTAPLQKGSTGALVKVLQAFLIHEKYLTGNADGIFGSGTTSALTKFQKDTGISETGIFDEATYGKVNERCKQITTEINEAANTPQDLAGGFLEANIKATTLSPNGTSLAYLATAGGDTIGYEYNLKTRVRREIWRYPFGEWLPEWRGTTIFLTTKASGEVDGYLFGVSSTGGTIQKLLGPRKGLTTLASPDGSKFLISAQSNRGIDLSLLEGKTNKEIVLGIATLPEKCVWTYDNLYVYCAAPTVVPAGIYPDDWYMGITPTWSDMLYRITAATGEAEYLGDLGKESTEGIFDAYNLKLDSKETTLFLMNRVDGGLWTFEL